jgi:hypothetical protein
MTRWQPSEEGERRHDAHRIDKGYRFKPEIGSPVYPGRVRARYEALDRRRKTSSNPDYHKQ